MGIGQNADYTANTSNMEESISTMRSNNQSMADLNEQIKGILMQKFAEQGITGDTADMMINKYMERIKPRFEEFLREDEEYIGKTETVKALFEDNASKTAGIINRI